MNQVCDFVYPPVYVDILSGGQIIYKGYLMVIHTKDDGSMQLRFQYPETNIYLDLAVVASPSDSITSVFNATSLSGKRKLFPITIHPLTFIHEKTWQETHPETLVKSGDSYRWVPSGSDYTFYIGLGILLLIVILFLIKKKKS